MNCGANAEAGERITFPIPVNLEIAHLHSLTVLYEKACAIVDKFTLRLASELRRTPEHENCAASI